jgi:hypothetical protein
VGAGLRNVEIANLRLEGFAAEIAKIIFQDLRLRWKGSEGEKGVRVHRQRAAEMPDKCHRVPMGCS